MFLLLALAGVAHAQIGALLAPQYDINFPATSTAANPLNWLGANGPYAPGPNVYGISADVPAGCTVEQAFYVARHGSRYPDTSAYAGWVDMANRFSAANNYTATGSLAFLPSWKPVLTNPGLQIANLSPTGQKEAFDMAYALRTRYPDLYTEGDDLYVWANNYSRVLQTARLFTTGFLGVNASSLGHVVSVTSSTATGFVDNIGNSLAPSDSCPNFVDTSGGTYATNWTAVYVPPIQARLQALVAGNLTFTQSDIAQMPYLCGFESQITGRVSPWCGVFTDEELQQYQYSNDLRYYYGVGPGTALPATMMLPFLQAVVGLLAQGPGQSGTAADGSAFAVPNLLVNFLNDGQLNELITAAGVHDDQAALSATTMDPERLYIGNRFTTMRGQFALERLSCAVQPLNTSTQLVPVVQRSGTGCVAKPVFAASAQNNTFVRITLNDVVYPLPSCQNGPGYSCLLADYADYVEAKYNASGNWAINCNVTKAGAPSVVQGATFYTDLTSDFLQVLSP